MIVYNVKQTQSAPKDIRDIAYYLCKCLKNSFAADGFLDFIEKEICDLEIFPLKNRGIGYVDDEKEIRIKLADTYNIFYVVDMNCREVTVLRVLNKRKDWEWPLKRW